MRTTKDDLNVPSSNLRRVHFVRRFYETQGTNRSSLIALGAGRKCKAGLLRIVHERNEIYLMKGAVR